MSSTSIRRVHARRVWDSRGRPTVEAEVTLEGGAMGRAIAPAGASTGSMEALDLRDGGKRLGGLDVGRAVANVNEAIGPAIVGRNAADQEDVDRVMIELDGTEQKSRLGGNAIIATSMAVAWAAASARGLPLWRYLLRDRSPPPLPLPEIQIFGGGKHAQGRVDIQDFLIVCPAAESFAEALEWTAEVFAAAGKLMAEAGRLQGVADEGGWWPAFDDNEQALSMLTKAIERAGYRPREEVAIALDIAASSFGEKGRYRLGLERRELETDGMIDLLMGWLGRYPIVSVEDPVAEDDVEGFIRFTERAGRDIQVVGDDFLVTSADRVRMAASRKACSAVLLKPNQCGTLTETKAAWDAAQATGMGAIVSARSGESEDVTIVHLAMGWGVPELKVGSFSRSERMAKWNEALRIEEELGEKAAFAGRNALAR
jgi:enolase